MDLIQPEPSDDDLLAIVKEVTQINRIIREGLTAWDSHRVFRERLSAVERGDSPAA